MSVDDNQPPVTRVTFNSSSSNEPSEPVTPSYTIDNQPPFQMRQFEPSKPATPSYTIDNQPPAPVYPNNPQNNPEVFQNDQDPIRTSVNDQVDSAPRGHQQLQTSRRANIKAYNDLMDEGGTFFVDLENKINLSDDDLYKKAESDPTYFNNLFARAIQWVDDRKEKFLQAGYEPDYAAVLKGMIDDAKKKVNSHINHGSQKSMLEKFNGEQSKIHNPPSLKCDPAYQQSSTYIPVQTTPLLPTQQHIAGNRGVLEFIGYTPYEIEKLQANEMYNFCSTKAAIKKNSQKNADLSTKKAADEFYHAIDLKKILYEKWNKENAEDFKKTQELLNDIKTNPNSTASFELYKQNLPLLYSTVGPHIITDFLQLKAINNYNKKIETFKPHLDSSGYISTFNYTIPRQYLESHLSEFPESVRNNVKVQIAVLEKKEKNTPLIDIYNHLVDAATEGTGNYSTSYNFLKLHRAELAETLGTSQIDQYLLSMDTAQATTPQSPNPPQLTEREMLDRNVEKTLKRPLFPKPGPFRVVIGAGSWAIDQLARVSTEGTKMINGAYDNFARYLDSTDSFKVESLKTAAADGSMDSVLSVPRVIAKVHDQNFAKVHDQKWEEYLKDTRKIQDSVQAGLADIPSSLLGLFSLPANVASLSKLSILDTRLASQKMGAIKDDVINEGLNDPLKMGVTLVGGFVVGSPLGKGASKLGSIGKVAAANRFPVAFDHASAFSGAFRELGISSVNTAELFIKGKSPVAKAYWDASRLHNDIQGLKPGRITEPNLGAIETLRDIGPSVKKGIINSGPNHVAYGGATMEPQFVASVPRMTMDLDIFVANPKALQKHLIATVPEAEFTAEGNVLSRKGRHAIDIHAFPDKYPQPVSATGPTPKAIYSDDHLLWGDRLFGTQRAIPRRSQVLIAGNDYPGGINQERLDFSGARKYSAVMTDVSSPNKGYRLGKDIYDAKMITQELVSVERQRMALTNNRLIDRYITNPLKVRKLYEIEVRLDRLLSREVGVVDSHSVPKIQTLRQVTDAFERDLYQADLPTFPKPPKPHKGIIDPVGHTVGQIAKVSVVVSPVFKGGQTKDSLHAPHLHAPHKRRPHTPPSPRQPPRSPPSLIPPSPRQPPRSPYPSLSAGKSYRSKKPPQYMYDWTVYNPDPSLGVVSSRPRRERKKSHNKPPSTWEWW